MKKAFTLIEMVITMTIIGIVLILTVPNFVNDFTRRSQSASLMKIYLGTAEAVKVLMVDERAKSLMKTHLYITESESVSDTAGYFLLHYYKLAEDCGITPSRCFADSYRSLNKNETVKIPEDGAAYCGKLASGTSICIEPMKTTHAVVTVDINAKDGPNIAGRDFFTFYIYNDGKVGDMRNNANDCNSNEYGIGCFTKLRKNKWVMDY